MSCCNTPERFDPNKAGTSEMPPEVAAIADATRPDLIRFKGGRSQTGTNRPEIAQDGEAIVKQHRLKQFAVEPTVVTNARFAAFVADTGYATISERFGWGLVFRGLLQDPDNVAPSGTAPWWGAVDGACWFAPTGPGSSVADRPDHPVTHIAWEDARAFAKWAGGRLPTEAEWEHAARSGHDDDRRFPWGEQEPDDTDFLPCNIFQGQFPKNNTAADGWEATSPVKAFQPNEAGLYDVVGNVWEWTAEPFRIRSASKNAKARNAHAAKYQEKLLKGGSFLCHISYCYRYRIPARLSVVADSGGCNAGLRVFYDV